MIGEVRTSRGVGEERLAAGYPPFEAGLSDWPTRSTGSPSDEASLIYKVREGRRGPTQLTHGRVK